MKWFLVLFLMTVGFAVGYSVPKEKVMEVVRVNQDEPVLLLPDLIVLPPRQISMNSGQRVMRFSTTFANIGDGPLELIGHKAVGKELTYASQYILNKDGAGVYREVGEFVFHPGHDHWHVDDYVFYELWSMNQQGEPAELKASTEKMSFCIWDEHRYDGEVNGEAPSRVYTSPCTRISQGMSVGWGDTYTARVEGQEISLQGLADGTYLFVSKVNPDRKIFEKNYDNNESRVKVELAGNNLRRID